MLCLCVPQCKGHRQVKCFVELKVEWQCHTGDQVVHGPGATGAGPPADLVKQASGVLLFDETKPAVQPVADCRASHCAHPSHPPSVYLPSVYSGFLHMRAARMLHSLW